MISINFTEILVKSKILQNKLVIKSIITLCILFVILNIGLILGAIIPAEYLHNFLKLNFQNIEVVIPLIVSMGGFLFIMLLLIDASKGAKKVYKFKEMVKEIYAVMEERKEEIKNTEFEISGYTSRYSDYKTLITRKYENGKEAHIGFDNYNGGGLYVKLIREKTKTFLQEANKVNKDSESWVEEDNTVFREADINLLRSDAESIVSIITQKYTPILNEVLGK